MGIGLFRESFNFSMLSMVSRRGGVIGVVRSLLVEEEKVGGLRGHSRS